MSIPVAHRKIQIIALSTLLSHTANNNGEPFILTPLHLVWNGDYYYVVAESADMLEKPSMRGIKKSVVDKYSDQAHFIYELLRNADDAKATRARFVLEKDRLIFAHNGSRRFSVSDPSNEDADSTAGTLGDINAITERRRCASRYDPRFPR